MRNGFTFNNRHSSEFSVTVRTKSRSVTPSAKSFAVNLPYRDGEYDFSSSNSRGREHYNNRVFAITVTVTADNLGELQSKIGSLSRWLHGSGELIFDDIPLIIWHGKIADEIIYMPEHGGKTAVMEVSFSAQPFGKNVFGTEGPCLDDPVELDSDIPLSMEEMYSFEVTKSDNINIVNFGDRPVRPVIVIEGNAAAMKLTLGEKSLSFTASGSVTVDFDRETVTDKNGVLRVSGEFFEFPEGINALNITNSNSGKLTVRVVFVPEYMYTANYKDIDWGDGNA